MAKSLNILLSRLESGDFDVDDVREFLCEVERSHMAMEISRDTYKDLKVYTAEMVLERGLHEELDEEVYRLLRVD